MAIERKSAVDQIEIPANNYMQVRIVLSLVEGKQALSHSYHRTAIPHGVPPELQMAAVCEHLVQMGYPELSKADIDRVVAMHAAMVAAMPVEA